MQALEGLDLEELVVKGRTKLHGLRWKIDANSSSEEESIESDEDELIDFTEEPEVSVGQLRGIGFGNHSQTNSHCRRKGHPCQ